MGSAVSLAQKGYILNGNGQLQWVGANQAMQQFPGLLRQAAAAGGGAAAPAAVQPAASAFTPAPSTMVAGGVTNSGQAVAPPTPIFTPQPGQPTHVPVVQSHLFTSPPDPKTTYSWLFGGLPGVADASTGGVPASANGGNSVQVMGQPTPDAAAAAAKPAAKPAVIPLQPQAAPRQTLTSAISSIFGGAKNPWSTPYQSALGNGNH